MIFRSTVLNNCKQLQRKWLLNVAGYVRSNVCARKTLFWYRGKSPKLGHCGTAASCPANTRRLSNAVLMLAHRLRRWPSINTALNKRLVFAGMSTSESDTLICLFLHLSTCLGVCVLVTLTVWWTQLAHYPWLCCPSTYVKTRTRTRISANLSTLRQNLDQLLHNFYQVFVWSFNLSIHNIDVYILEFYLKRYNQAKNIIFILRIYQLKKK